jgi:hypothetical protein
MRKGLCRLFVIFSAQWLGYTCVGFSVRPQILVSTAARAGGAFRTAVDMLDQASANNTLALLQRCTLCLIGHIGTCGIEGLQAFRLLTHLT